MEKLLVAVFDAESKAFEAKKALHQLEKEDVIDVFDQAVVARNADGSATVREGNDLTPVRTLAGTTLAEVRHEISRSDFFQGDRTLSVYPSARVFWKVGVV